MLTEDEVEKITTHTQERTMTKVTFVSQTATDFIVSVTCPMCGKKTTVSVPKDGLMRYQMGAHIQDAFPNKSATEREYLLSGMCKSCQDNFFNADAE